MGNKIITEKDFWMCTMGAAPAQLQGTRKGTKKESGELYITVEDKATSSWIDFGCKKWMILMALAAAAAIVILAIVGVLTVATGGLALVALGAVAGLVGAAIGAVVGACLCGQKVASKRVWSSSKSNFISQGTKTITGDHFMTCAAGGVVKFAPNIKSWSQAVAIGTLNYAASLAEGALAGAAVGLGGGVLSGAYSLALPTLSSIGANIAGGFTGIFGASRVLFGASGLANDNAMGNVNSGGDVVSSFGNAAIPEVGSLKRIVTGQAQPSDALLLLYLLHLKTPAPKENTAPKDEPTQPKEEETVKPNEVETEITANKNEGKNGEAFEDGNTKPKPGSAEHKEARWQKYQQQHPESKMTYQEWSNRYDANIKNANKGNAAADEYQSKIGWGDREVPMKIDENGEPIRVRKGQETRNLDIADAEGKKAVEVKDYSSKKVPYNSEIQSELAFDKELAKKGWDVEWVFTDKGPSAGLEEALKSPPPIKYKIIK